MNSLTQNGALSLSTTSNYRLDFFFKVLRDTSEEKLIELIENAWNENSSDTLKLVFHLRDCRGGKGEKKQFHRCLKWLSEKHPECLKKNLHLISEYGYYKDVLSLLGTSMESEALKLIVDQLRVDRAKLDTPNKYEITLVGKWTPTEGCSHDKKYNAVAKICKLLKCNKQQYRRDFVVPLRTHLNIVEKHICSGNWDDIDFSKVPSVAMNRYKKLFSDKASEKYKQFLEAVGKGESKINTKTLYPHEIIRSYLKGSQLDETVELQWKQFMSDLKSNTQLKNSLSVIDVSGSMTCNDNLPLSVAVALGLVTSELIEGSFHNTWITFSSTPVLEQVKGDTLYDKVNNMKNGHWQMSTNLQAVFELILTSAKAFNVKQEHIPSTLFIFSDMQFNQACTNNDKTNFQSIDDKYKEAGYERPRLVFWNLNGDTVDFPVGQHDANTALVSGFSPALLDLFTGNEAINPYSIMRKVLDSDRYSKIGV